jgi:hypothetical protein
VVAGPWKQRVRPHTYVKLRLDGKPPPTGVLPQRDHCLCVNIIYFWYKARVDLETRKKLSYFIIEQSRLSTEQFEGAGARRQPSGKQVIVGHHVNGNTDGTDADVAHAMNAYPK